MPKKPLPAAPAENRIIEQPITNALELNGETPVPLIDRMPEQYDRPDSEPPMRLGSYPCKLNKDTLIYKAYGEELIYERHRNRYEVNGKYRADMTQAGIIFSGVSTDGRRVEVIELPEETHPWFVGVIFHPEFKSRPVDPHPLFVSFIGAAVEYGKNSGK